MCGLANIKVGDTEVQLDISYYGNHLAIGEYDYDERKNTGRDEIIEQLHKFTKEQLINLVIGFVDEGMDMV